MDRTILPDHCVSPDGIEPPPPGLQPSALPPKLRRRGVCDGTWFTRNLPPTGALSLSYAHRGPTRIRTGNLLSARQVLDQLSYKPWELGPLPARPKLFSAVLPVLVPVLQFPEPSVETPPPPGPVKFLNHDGPSGHVTLVAPVETPSIPAILIVDLETATLTPAFAFGVPRSPTSPAWAAMGLVIAMTT